MNISWIIFNDFRFYLRIARLRFATLETRSERILLIKFFILFSTTESSRIDFFQHLHTIEHEICSLSVVICSFVALTHSLVCHRNHSNHLHYYCHSRISGKKSRSRARCEIGMGKCTRYVCMWRWWCRRDYNTKFCREANKRPDENHQTGTSQMKDVNNNEVVITIFFVSFYVFLFSVFHRRHHRRLESSSCALVILPRSEVLTTTTISIHE